MLFRKLDKHFHGLPDLFFRYTINDFLHLLYLAGKLFYFLSLRMRLQDMGRDLVCRIHFYGIVGTISCT